MKKTTLLLLLISSTLTFSQTKKRAIDNDYEMFKKRFFNVKETKAKISNDTITVDYLPKWVLTPPKSNNMFVGISDPNTNEKEALFQAISRALVISSIIPNCNKYWMNDYFTGDKIGVMSSISQEIFMFYNSAPFGFNSIKLVNIHKTIYNETIILVEIQNDNKRSMSEFSCKASFYKNNTVETGESISGKVIIETASNNKKLKPNKSVIYMDIKNNSVCSEAESSKTPEPNSYYRYSFSKNIQRKYQIVTFSGLWPVYVSSFFQELADKYDPRSISVSNVEDNYSQKFISLTRLSANEEAVFISDSVSVAKNKFDFGFVLK